MKKLTKVLSVIMIAIMMVSCFSTVFAAVATNPGDWDNQPQNANIKTDSIKQTLSSVINVVSIAGSAVAIIALIILGIKYMMGSAEEKAEYKKTLLPYFFGAVMVFGASMLTGFIYNIVKQ